MEAIFSNCLSSLVLILGPWDTAVGTVVASEGDELKILFSVGLLDRPRKAGGSWADGVKSQFSELARLKEDEELLLGEVSGEEKGDTAEPPG